MRFIGPRISAIVVPFRRTRPDSVCGPVTNSPHGCATARYTFSRDRIDDLAADASPAIRAQEGTFSTSSIGNEFFYDARNSRFTPTDGYFLRYDVDLAGLGGTERFLRNEVSAGIFESLFGTSIVGSLDGSAGLISDLDDEIRISSGSSWAAPSFVDSNSVVSGRVTSRPMTPWAAHSSIGPRPKCSSPWACLKSLISKGRRVQ